MNEPAFSVKKIPASKFHFVDSKYRPTPPGEVSKYVVVTTDNQNFSMVNINEASTVEEVKVMIGNRLNIQDWALCTFHLAEFGCNEGHALDDSTFHQLIFNSQKLGLSNEVLKLFVGYSIAFDPSGSPGRMSMEYEYASNTYPSTPEYMLNDDTTDHRHPPLPTSKPDYFSSKLPYEASPRLEVPPTQQLNHHNPQWQHVKLGRHGSGKSKQKELPNPHERKDDAPELPNHFAGNSRRPSEDSFKVIRQERREINFDDRRASPYDRRPYYPLKTSVQTGVSPPVTDSVPQRANKRTTPLIPQNPTMPSQMPGNSSVHIDRKPSQTRGGSKLERTPSQLVAMRSAPPPPATGGLQRSGSKKLQRNGSQTGRFYNDNTGKLGRQNSTRAESKLKRIPSGPPRIDIGEFDSMGLSAELGLGFDAIQNRGSPSNPPTQIAQPSAKLQDEKFHENEISFENAPLLDESDDSSSSDEGLWAKKPPPSKPFESAKSPRKDKPQLQVEIMSPEIDGTYPVSRELGSPPTKPPAEYLNDINLGGWAVRPPAEVVYENLERFFPDADLDRPIIIDPQGSSPPASPSNDNVTHGRLQYYPPLSPVPEPSKESAKFTQSSSDSVNLNSPQGQDTTLTPSLIASTSLAQSKAASDSSMAKDTKDQPLSTYSGVSDSTGGSSNHQPASTGSKTGLSMRTKSLRIVVQEATERRKRFQTLANANNKGALLRRKSTKMWGQKVVEVKPSEIKRGQLSRLRDNRGKVKQFVWVKGELIGKGSFGKVYLALNATAGEMIAVKQVEVPQTISDKSSEKQKEMIDTLHSEVETMKDLDHFNIVQYLGFEALPDFYNLFLEYVPGGSVGSALRKHGRFEETVIKSFTRQVLDALSYLHSCGILHRDLKSDNLLIDLDGVCKISDFGISKKSRDIYTNDAEMSMQGTIFWMAPEVIHNVVHNEKQGYSAKVDIWSLGCVVLEMFAGRRPWSNDEAIGAMYKLGNARLAPPIPEDTIPFVSEDGKDIIDNCFTIDPEQRPTASQLLDHPFCVIPPNFRFRDTQLAQVIRVNDKRVGK